MQRRLVAMAKLKTSVKAGSMKASDAVHRALQMLESTPQPVRLQEPRLAKISQQLVDLAAKSEDTATETIQHRLDRLLQEDRRVYKQLELAKDAGSAKPAAMASPALVQRHLRELAKLKEAVDAGSLEPIHAAHRAVQRVESLDQPLRLQAPQMLDVCEEFLNGIADKSTKSFERLQSRFKLLMDEIKRAPAPKPKRDVPKQPSLADTAHFTKLYSAFDLGQHPKAFDLLNQITPAMWHRTPNANRNQVLKIAASVMSSAVPNEASARQFLQFIQAIKSSKGLPPNWIALPTSCAAMSAASIQAKDPAVLLQLYKAHLSLHKRSTGLFAKTRGADSGLRNVPPSSAMLVAILDTLGALQQQSELPEIIRNFPGTFSQSCLVAMLRVLALPESAPFATDIVRSFPLQVFVDGECQGPLLRTMLKADLVVEALDVLFQLHELGDKSNARRIPWGIQTDILVELYKLRDFDRFHSAFEELCIRDYQVGLHEFRALSSVVPSHVLRDMLGRKEYNICLQEAQRHANRKSQRIENQTMPPGGIDLRSVPASMCKDLLILHLKAQEGLSQEVIIFVKPLEQPVVEAALIGESIDFVAQRQKIVVSAQAVESFIERHTNQRLRDFFWKFMALRVGVVYSLVVGGMSALSTSLP
ncbi:hypothetical protein AeNC1_004405 [Aphanomyces euteiches]|nr:hypothetical protein AeNC1_004405 [Aphanomyces euteiches]